MLSVFSLGRKATVLPTGVLSIMLFGIPLHAQTGSTAAFSGTVRDATAAVLPGVTVTATHVGTAREQSVVTDEEGRYRLGALPLGEYEMQVSLPGFRSEIRPGLVLTVGQTQVLNFTLEIGEIRDAITVEGTASFVETTSSSVSGLVTAEAVHNLPLNGRSFDQLITLSAGTVNYRTRSNNAARGTAAMYSAGGARPNTTKLMVDGSEYAGATAVNTNVSTASGNLLGVDGIQEFAIVTNSGDASYGKKYGGQVNIVTKSGSNEFHGTVFEFNRNDVFDARNFFDQDKPSLRRNNYGFSIGGPIVENKSFFFGNFERLTEKRGNTLRAVVPNAQVRQGIFPDASCKKKPPPPGEPCVIEVHPNIQPLMDLFPAPTGRDFGDGTAESINTATDDIEQTFVVTRLDHNFSDSDTLFGRYWIDTGDRLVFNDNNLGLFPEQNPFRTQLFTLGYKKIISPQLLNQANFAFNRGRMLIDLVPREGLTVPAEMILVPGETKQGGVRVGVSSGGAASDLPTLGGRGSTGTAGRFVHRNTFQVSDNVNYTTGPHHFQVGFEVQRIHSNEFQPTQGRGFLQFRSLEDFAKGKPRRIRGPLPGSDAGKGWRQTYFGIYAQDSFGLTPTFTLNLGLRWEWMSNPTEVNGKVSSFVPAGSELTGIYPDKPTIVDAVFAENPSGDFAPRLGFAWDVLGDGRTAVRGGVGYFFAQIENEHRRGLGPAAPFFTRVSVNKPPYPNPGQALGDARLGKVTPIGLHQFPSGVPTSLQYNLRIEQEVASQTVLAIAYVGSHGSHLLRQTNPQTPEVFVNAAGRLEVPQFIKNPKIDDGGTFNVWDANSNYSALQVDFEKRLSQGLRFKLAFTWSKIVDDAVETNSGGDGIITGDVVGSDHKSSRGPAPFNVGRQFVANWSYELPLGSHSGARGVLLNGWQLLGIVQVADGGTLTPTNGFARAWDPGGDDDGRPDRVPGRSNNAILGGPDQYFDPLAFEIQPEFTIGNLGNGTLTGPGFATLDFSVFKSFDITETTQLQFRSEFFNLLNRTNFGMPDNVLFRDFEERRGAAGRIQSTVSTSREIQLALKLIF